MFLFLNSHIFFHRSFKIPHNCPNHKTTSMSRSIQVGRVRGADAHSAMEGLMLVLLSFLLLVARVEVPSGNHTLSTHCDLRHIIL
jgi:hypothetical protein